jgi:streptomycin 6-kinase
MDLDRLFATQHDSWAQWFPDVHLQQRTEMAARLAEAIRAWDLDDIAPLHGGHVAYVAAAGEVVVKVNPRIPAEPGLEHEGRALRHWAATGAAVPLLDERDGGFTLLLERVRPGTMLVEEGLPVGEALATLGALARRLAEAGPGDGFPSLAGSPMAGDWLEALDGDDRLEQLLSEEPTALAHLDLHVLNVLRRGADWVVIDPKPHLADPHAECFALLERVGLINATRQAAWEAVRAYADAAGLDAQWLAAWTAVRARAESVLVQRAPELPPRWSRWAHDLERLATKLG